MVQNRESPSCAHCGSSLRMRSLMRILSSELFGTSLPLAQFPLDKSLHGIGLSDWDGYATLLEQRLSYTNTFFHRAPRLDITDIRPSWIGRFHFVIASDVFEHIPVEGLGKAFRNAFRLLRPGGFLLLTVPFFTADGTVEHFPDLHDFQIRDVEGRKVLLNRTRAGELQTFDSLTFHGGDGSTLEMRRFGEKDLLDQLREAGFGDIRICAEDCAAFGVLWPSTEHAPIVARRPLDRHAVWLYKGWRGLISVGRALRHQIYGRVQ